MSDDLPDADELAQFVAEQTIKESNMSLSNYSNLETEETKFDGDDYEEKAPVAKGKRGPPKRKGNNTKLSDMNLV